MNQAVSLFALFGVALLVSCSAKQDGEKEVPHKKNEPVEVAAPESVSPGGYTISRATTYITGPLTADGKLDFIEALRGRAGQGVTPQNNAAVKFWEIAGPDGVPLEERDKFKDRIGAPQLWVTPATFHSLDSYLQRSPAITPKQRDEALDHQSDATAVRWTRKQYPQIAGWLDYNHTGLDQIVAATRLPLCYSPFVGDRAVDPAFGNYRSFSRALTARAQLRNAPSMAEQAWTDILATYRLGRTVAKGPLLTSQLVGMAIDGLARKACIFYIADPRRTLEQLDQCQRDLETLGPFPTLKKSFTDSERIQLVNMVVKVADGDKQIFEHLEMFNSPRPKDPQGKALEELTRKYAVNWDQVLKDTHLDLDVLIAAIDEPIFSKARVLYETHLNQRQGLAGRLKTGSQVRNYVASASDPTQALTAVVSSALSNYLTPALFAGIEADARTRQNNQLTQVCLAISAHRLKTGSYPASKDAINSAWLESWPNDVLTGQPLRYKPRAGGYLLYSAGNNGKDEGGNNLYDDGAPEGDDMRIRLPLDAKSILP